MPALPDDLVRALNRQHLLIVWGDLPFPLLEHDPPTPAVTIKQWIDRAAQLPPLPIALHTLPPVPILSLDPTDRLEKQFQAAARDLRVVKAQDDVPTPDTHSLLKLAGDCASRTGVVLSHDRIMTLRSNADKRYLLDEARSIIVDGAILLVGCDPANADFKTWWSVLGATLGGVPCFALDTGPQGAMVLAQSFAELSAELMVAYEPPKPKMESDDVAFDTVEEATRPEGEATRSGGGAYGGRAGYGGKFVGRDRLESVRDEMMGGRLEPPAPLMPAPAPAPSAKLTVQKLMVDAAAPARVRVKLPFKFGVLVRRASSPPLHEADLPQVESSEMQVVVPEDAPYLRLRVDVEAPECDIAGESRRSFKLLADQDRFFIPFYLTPRQAGNLSIFVTVYQEDDWLSNAFVQTEAVEQAVGKVELKVVSQAPHPDRWLDMELRLRDQQNDHYPLEIELGDGSYRRGAVSLDLAQWAASGDTTADGQALFDALFQDKDLREMWGTALGKSQHRLRVRLWIDPPVLHRLPWELLRDDDEIIAADADTPFSRYLPIDQEWGGPLAARPLRVLAAISIPDDLNTQAGLPSAEEWQREQQTLQAVFAEVSGGLAQLTILPPPITLARLEDELQHGYHILHLIGHGAFDAQHDRAALYLQTAEAHKAIVPGNDFASLLDRLQLPPKLVVLMACRSAQRSTRAAFIGLGPQLVERGLPAVVAMQDDISVDSARRFGAKFYQRLLEHGVVDLAMNEARSALITDKRYDAAVPVLFMRLRHGRLWGEAPHSGEAPPIETVAPSSGPTRSAAALTPEEIASLRRQLNEARENLRLIEERKAEYVLETDVPLQLLKEERRKREQIAELERKLGWRG